MLTYQIQGNGRVTSMVIYKTTENSFSDDNDSANFFSLQCENLQM